MLPTSHPPADLVARRGTRPAEQARQRTPSRRRGTQAQERRRRPALRRLRRPGRARVRRPHGTRAGRLGARDRRARQGNPPPEGQTQRPGGARVTLAQTNASPDEGAPMPEPPKKLTAKQEAFVREYLIDLNATQAAIRAGYSERTAYRTGAD